LDLPDAALADLLRKMRLDVDGSGRNVTVSYPAFRTDIRHPVDLYADLAIGHGYGSYPMKLVPTMTPSTERPEERISSRVRAALIGQGFWEVLSLVQTTAQKHFTRLRIEPGDQHAIIANPKNVEVNIVRCHLLTGILETLEKNRRKAAPQQFFEVGNIVLLAQAPRLELVRSVASVLPCWAGSRYAQIRSTADALCRELGAEPVYSAEVHPTFVKGVARRSTPRDGMASIARSAWRAASRGAGAVWIAVPVALARFARNVV
jgi:phenylalanyl-tRNA synthetase beta chain